MENGVKIFSYLLLLVILILGVSFAILNATPVTINYYIGQQQIALSLLLVIAFAIGCLMGIIVGAFMYCRLKSQNYKLRNRIKIAEKEISNLRTMPLQDNR